MQSTNDGKRYFSTKENASIATPRDGIRATRKAAMGVWAGPGVLIVFFLASLAYVVLGGTLALEAPPIPEPEASAAAVTAELAEVGGAPRNENASARPEEGKQ